MVRVTGYTADLIVETLDSKRKALKADRTSQAFRGPLHAEKRKRLLALERELTYAISAINTGEGVTRAHLAGDH